MLIFWLLAGLLSVVTVAALLATGMAKTSAPAGRSEGALAIYKDQLTELERDVASGALGEVEAESQRTEVSRRLLLASREQEAMAQSGSRFPKVLVLVVPVLAAALYWHLGHYNMPDVPHAERLAAADKSNDFEAMIARVEAQLEKQPDDLQGWQLLVSNYLNMGRYGDAANAMAQIIRISGPNSVLYADMGEAMVYGNNGLMTAQAVAIFDEALKLDKNNAKALFYRGLGLSQEGKVAEAKATFRDLLAHAPANAPWKKAVEQQLARLDPKGAAPKIGDEQMQNAEAMKPEERIAMIRGMVDGLDEKLKANPQDIEGWLRLIRARTVLGDADKANAALATARATFATNAADMKLVEDLAQELKLK
jgi:cytochrome c-type biogenesis protein CcmH